MGRVKEFYHDQIIAEQETSDAEIERMMLEHDIDMVAEACANDIELFNLFMQRVFHHRHV